MSSFFGRAMPGTRNSSQILAHGRPNKSGTWYSITAPREAGVALPAGMYFYRIESADGIATGRFVLMR